jgi:hypothetical protein
MMKDESGVCSKLELIEAISKSLSETTLSFSSPLQLMSDSRKRLDGGGGLEHQQEELQVVSILQSIVLIYFLTVSLSRVKQTPFFHHNINL